MVCAAPTLQINQRVTPEMIDEIERYTNFAPLHTPIGAYIMREALQLFPGVPNFACSDSYFYRTMPEVVTHIPIPAEYSHLGVRRIGFHGISHESLSTSCSLTCLTNSSWHTWAIVHPSPPFATTGASTP